MNKEHDTAVLIPTRRRGRPRQFFLVKGEMRSITVTGVKEPDEMHASGTVPVWRLGSRAEVNRMIKDLEEARDRVFPSDDSKLYKYATGYLLKSAMSEILWEAYVTGNPDCILTTREGRNKVVEEILDLIANQNQ